MPNQNYNTYLHIMNKELLHERFEYKDGQLIYKISTGRRVKIGDVAGTIDTNGYRRISINKKRYMAHRLVWTYHNGEIQTGYQIDHMNGVKDDNRIENLRLATPSQNSSNRPKNKINKSGFKGVSWHKRDKKWQADIMHNNKTIRLGLFATPELAHDAYVGAATKHQGEFAFTK